MGFRSAHVDEALDYSPDRESALDWLCKPFFCITFFFFLCFIYKVCMCLRMVIGQKKGICFERLLIFSVFRFTC